MSERPAKPWTKRIPRLTPQTNTMKLIGLITLASRRLQTIPSNMKRISSQKLEERSHPSQGDSRLQKLRRL